MENKNNLTANNMKERHILDFYTQIIKGYENFKNEAALFASTTKLLIETFTTQKNNLKGMGINLPTFLV